MKWTERLARFIVECPAYAAMISFGAIGILAIISGNVVHNETMIIGGGVSVLLGVGVGVLGTAI